MSLTSLDTSYTLAGMFAKIFSQIFDSSIAKDHVVRHVFMDLLVLADRDGVVDMTLDAISRRTNVPEEMVHHAIIELTRPDQASRSKEEDGRRLALLDSHRDWGWQIVNYDHYRNLIDEESRRAYFRDKKREQRKKDGKPSGNVQLVRDSPTLSTQAEAEAEGEAKGGGTSPFVQDNAVTCDGNAVARDPHKASEPDDFNQDPEGNIPDGLAILQYAGFVLQGASIPASYGLKVKMGDALELLARDEHCTMAVATKRMLDRVRDAGPQKWNFWLQDGGWQLREEVGISTEGWEPDETS